MQIIARRRLDPTMVYAAGRAARLGHPALLQLRRPRRCCGSQPAGAGLRGPRRGHRLRRRLVGRHVRPGLPRTRRLPHGLDGQDIPARGQFGQQERPPERRAAPGDRRHPGLVRRRRRVGVIEDSQDGCSVRGRSDRAGRVFVVLADRQGRPAARHGARPASAVEREHATLVRPGGCLCRRRDAGHPPAGRRGLRPAGTRHP
jgi:hypothetical protein